MKIKTTVLTVLGLSVLCLATELGVTYGSLFTGYSQVVVGPPAPTTIATVPSLQGYGVVINWEAPTSPDITGFRIERYSWDEATRTWSPAFTIVINDPALRTYVDMAGMGRWAYRVQSTKTTP